MIIKRFKHHFYRWFLLGCSILLMFLINDTVFSVSAQAKVVGSIKVNHEEFSVADYIKKQGSLR